MERQAEFQLLVASGGGLKNVTFEAETFEKKHAWVGIFGEHMAYATRNTLATLASADAVAAAEIGRYGVHQVRAGYSGTAPSISRGYLKKESSDAAGGMFKNWKTRYVVLEKGILRYYEEELPEYPCKRRRLLLFTISF